MRRSNISKVAACLATACWWLPTPASADPAPVTPSPTTQPAKPADAERIKVLIGKLQDADWRSRKQAQADLVKLGEPALAALKAAAESSPLDETRTAAAAAIQQIEEDQLIGPSLITIDMKDQPIRKVLAELSKQSRASLAPLPSDLWRQRGEKEQRLTMQFDQAPFWVVMRRFEELTGLELRTVDGEARIMEGVGMMAGRPQVAGPFLVTANMLSRTVGSPGTELEFAL